MTATTGTADSAGVQLRPTGTSAYVGRFAPSPSGDLHLGSLYAAAASYLDARANGGRWILRIEDLDRPREVCGAKARMLATLRAFGFEWDGDVVLQSERQDLYAAELGAMRERNLTFECDCSRLSLGDEDRYPGRCRERAARIGEAPGPTATRLRVEPGQIQFADRIQGSFRQDIAGSVGDFIVRRRDGIIAYAMAVVVDDAAQGITHVIRGADLLDNTPRQIYLQRALGHPAPLYAHIPVLTEPDGAKLAKSRRSIALDPTGAPLQLCSVLALLGLHPPPNLHRAGIGAIWRWAIERWDISRVPKRLSLPVPRLEPA